MINESQIGGYGTRIDDFGLRIPSGLLASLICSPIWKVISFGVSEIVESR